MKHQNISIFIPHAGCPHDCAFCNQRVISGAQHPPSPDEVTAILQNLPPIPCETVRELAFFGGSFTAIDNNYRHELLKAAQPFLKSGAVSSIRCSARPDYISNEILDDLWDYGVRTIELGAQSMHNDVLNANRRGHTAQDIINSSEKIKQHGFSLGLQMMTGLYKSTFEKDYQTALSLAQLNPDTMRIYPTVVLKGTYLAALVESGEYNPPSIDESLPLLADLLELFEERGIKVIRAGLHASRDIEENFVAGCYHPSLRELSEQERWRRRIMVMIQKNPDEQTIKISAAKTEISKIAGFKRRNIEYFAEMGYIIKCI